MGDDEEHTDDEYSDDERVEAFQFYADMVNRVGFVITVLGLIGAFCGTFIIEWAQYADDTCDYS